MTDELRAAAERYYRRIYRARANDPAFDNRQKVYGEDIIAAYIAGATAEHPADDETPVTRDWLQTVTFPRGTIALPNYVSELLSTRGRYRQFYAALGIEVCEH